MRTENISKVCVALTYRGAGDRTPKSHVDRIPLKLVVMNPMAIVVARRMYGAELLAFQADNAG
jgi:hypothetical protein